MNSIRLVKCHICQRRQLLYISIFHYICEIVGHTWKFNLSANMTMFC